MKMSKNRRIYKPLRPRKPHRPRLERLEKLCGEGLCDKK